MSAFRRRSLPPVFPRGEGTVARGLIIASKKLDSKIKKHQEIVTLAIAKCDTIDRLLPKALADKQISEGEF